MGTMVQVLAIFNMDPMVQTGPVGLEMMVARGPVASFPVHVAEEYRPPRRRAVKIIFAISE